MQARVFNVVGILCMCYILLVMYLTYRDDWKRRIKRSTPARDDTESAAEASDVSKEHAKTPVEKKADPASSSTPDPAATSAPASEKTGLLSGHWLAPDCFAMVLSHLLSNLEALSLNIAVLATSYSRNKCSITIATATLCENPLHLAESVNWSPQYFCSRASHISLKTIELSRRSCFVLSETMVFSPWTTFKKIYPMDHFALLTPCTNN